MLQSKDPRIYDKSEEFFKDQEKASAGAKKPKAKPMHLKDYEREQLLTRGSEAFVSDEESETEKLLKMKQNTSMSYVEEQQAIKDSFKAAIDSDDDDDNDEGEFLQKRVKSAKELEREEKEYVQWLKGEGNRLAEEEQNDLNALKSYWSNPQLDSSEKFLRDYILNKEYKDKERDEIPRYNEIVGLNEDDDNDVGESSESEREEQFEKKFNFRYEEPDSEFIRSYPRTISGSVRRKDESRKQKRIEREERKKKEKEKKKEEIKQLKNLKRKEIMEKLDKLKEITGNEKVGFLEDDLEGDFDAAKYDALMKDVFSNDYYNTEDAEKPEFSDDEELNADDWDEWQGEANQEPGDGHPTAHCEDDEFNMDCDYDATSSWLQRDPKADRRGRRRRNSKFAAAIEKAKPTFNPDEKTFEEYFDEYYKLDYEDIIGDMPVRFNYRQVMANDFGLSTEEVLLCPDKELNQWCSVKKAMKYYTEEEERQNRTKFKRKARNRRKKMQLLPSLQQEVDEEPSTKVLRGDSEASHDDPAAPQQSQIGSSNKATVVDVKLSSRFNRLQSKWKRRHEKDHEDLRRQKLARLFKGAERKSIKKLSANRLAAYGLNKTSFKKKKRRNQNGS